MSYVLNDVAWQDYETKFHSTYKIDWYYASLLTILGQFHLQPSTVKAKNWTWFKSTVAIEKENGCR
jgi:hypothetical protein